MRLLRRLDCFNEKIGGRIWRLNCVSDFKKGCVESAQQTYLGRSQNKIMECNVSIPGIISKGNMRKSNQ